MKAIFAIALSTFREILRGNILFSVLLVAAAVVCAATLFGSVTIGSQAKLVKDFGLFAVSFFGTVLAVSSGVTLLTKEMKQKTIYNILSKPVSRWQFVVGKYVGLFAIVALLDAIFIAGLVAYAAGFDGAIDPLLFQGLLFTLLEANIVCAATIFFSSLVVTTTLAGLFTFATYVAGRSVPYLMYFFQDPDSVPEPILRAVQWCDRILPDLSLYAVGDRLVYGHSMSIHEFGYGAIYSLSYSAVLVTLACVIFRFRELK